MTIITTPYYANKHLSHPVIPDAGVTLSDERILADPHNPNGAFMRVSRITTSKEGDQEYTLALGIGSEDAIAMKMTVEAGASHMSLEFRNVGLGLQHSRSAAQTHGAMLIAAEAVRQIKRGQIPGFVRMKRRLGALLGENNDPKALSHAFAAYYRIK